MNLSSLFVQNISYWAAFSAGLLSFFSPCVLPLIPAWFTLVTGLSFDQLTSIEKKHLGFLKVLGPTVFFVLGFTFVFSLMGAAAGVAGQFLKNYGHWLQYATGAVMVFFGLYLVGVIKFSFLMREHRAGIKGRPLGFIGSFLVGMGFAAGWTPCVGPVLGSILALAVSEESANRGFWLLIVYSLGLGLPFLVISVAWGTAMGFLRKIKPVVRWSNRIVGVLLIILGALVISGRLGTILPQ